MKFIHLTDIHLVRPGQQLMGGDPAQRLDACLRDIETWHDDAKFCVISGDLAEFAQVEAYQFLKDRLESFGLPVFIMLGNHDNRKIFREVFPDHSTDTNGFIQHRHELEGNVFLFLDTTKDGKIAHEGEYCVTRAEWLENELFCAGNKPTFLFMHHPPFDLKIPFIDKTKLQDSDTLLDVMRKGKNIRHCFYGHVHRTTYVKWRGYEFTSLPSLNHQIPLNPKSVDGVFCNEPPAYAVVHVDGEQLTVHFNSFLHRDPLHQSY